MTRIALLDREQASNLKTVFEVAEAVMGFVPNSMLIMARDPDLLAAFAQLSAVILVRPGGIDPGLKALIMQAVSRAAGCQYCVAHSANLAASRAIPARKIEQLRQFETSPEFSEAERAALRFAHAAGQVPNAVSDAHFADLRRHYDEEQVIEIVATLSFLGFLNRWNDTFATPLESAPREFAERHLAASGWTLGKHRGATVDSPSPRSATRWRVRLFRWLFNRFAPKPRAL